MKTLAREQSTWHNRFAVIINQLVIINQGNSNSNVERCNIVAMTIKSNIITGCWKMNLTIYSKHMLIFRNNYHNIVQIIREKVSVTFSINPHKNYHWIVQIQQFHKILCAVTF